MTGHNALSIKLTDQDNCVVECLQELREIQEKKKRPLEEEGESQEIRMPSKKKKFNSAGKKKGKKFK